MTGAATAVRETQRTRSASGAATTIRADVQGLRAVAVVLVVLNHVFGWPTGGYIGVDVFFVISGFVITSLLLREVGRTGSISLANFYRRRARRILPAASVVIAVTALSSAALLPADRVAQVWGDAVAATLFSANWRMIWLQTDYFQQGLPPSPLQHYWSLSIEEQFYFVWPAIIIVTLLWSARWGVRSRRRALLVPALVIVGASLALSIWQVGNQPTLAYFSSFARFWELGAGVCLAILAPLLGRLGARTRTWLAYGGLATIAAGALFLNADSTFPGALALIPVLGTTAVIAAGCGAHASHDRVIAPITNRVASYIGDRSYSLYLWHFPLVVLAAAVFPPRTMTSVGIVVATVVLSELSYRFIEDPIRRSRWLERSSDSSSMPGARRANAIVALLVAVLLTIGIGVARGTHAEEATTPTTAPPAAADCYGAAALGRSDAQCPPPSALQPSVGELQADTGGAFSGDCYRFENSPPVSCTFGSEAPDALSVAVIGDSHAGMYLAILRKIADDLGWRVTTYVGWGCTWAPHEGQPCGEQTRLAQADFVDDSPYDVILTAGSRRATAGWDSRAELAAVEMWDAAAAAGSRIIAMESVGVPSEEALLCIQRVSYDPAKDDCATPADEAFSMTDEIAAVAGRARADVTVVATRDLVCAERECPSAVGGVIVFRDTYGHLTGTYLASMTPYVRERLMDAAEQTADR